MARAVGIPQPGGPEILTVIHREVRDREKPSDHVPVVVELDL